MDREMEDPTNHEEERVEDKKRNPTLISTSLSLSFSAQTN